MDNVEEMLQLLYRNEDILSQLYTVYVQKFPQMSTFWQKLVSDEKAHARWISILTKELENKRVFINKQRFSLQALSSFNSYVMNCISEAHTKNIDLLHALSLAVNCEKALIERKFFETFTTDSEEMKQTFLNLKTQTEKHIKYTEEAWEAERQRLGIISN